MGRRLLQTTQCRFPKKNGRQIIMMVMIIIINRNDVNSNQSPWGSEWGVGGGRNKASN